MTTPLVGQHWRGREHAEALAVARPSDLTSAGAVRVAQLQGVVMAVYGVSAPAAIRELDWHSAQLGVSVADLADDVMASINRRGVATSPGVLRTLLAGQLSPATGRGSDRRADPRGPGHPLVSVLHLVETNSPQPASDAAERWRWERDGLSRREAQVLHLIGQGWPNQDIAAAMFVTVNTVKSYIRSAYHKIGVTTRANAVRWALINQQLGSARPKAGTDTTCTTWRGSPTAASRADVSARVDAHWLQRGPAPERGDQ